jgi:hypothetical protein
VTSNLTSANMRAILSVQEDGNLVLLHDGTPVWASGNILPVAPPTPTPETRLPRLRALPGERFLRTDDGVWDGREATFMAGFSLWLQGRQAEMDVAIERLKEHGITSVRCLLNLGGDFWEGRGQDNAFTDPAFYPSLVPFAEWLESRGLYWHVCLFGGVEAFGAEPDWVRRGDVVTGHTDVIQRMHAYLDQTVGTLRDQSNVFYQIANEPGQIGYGEHSQVIVELGQHARELLSEDAPLDLGAQDEDHHEFAAPPANCFAYHLSRKPDWDHFASVKRLIEGDADAWAGPVFCDEPFNMGDKKERSTATAFCLAAMNRLKRVAISTFHANELLGCKLDHPDTIACLKAWSRGLDAIPIEVPGQGCNGHWSCSPVADGSFPPTEDASDDWDGPIRVYGRRDGDKWIGVSLREPKDYVMRWKGNRNPRVVDSFTWGSWKSSVYET